MQGFQKWLTGSSMSWHGLRWGAAAMSLAAHGAAASFAWVMIETKPAQVIEAFTVELVAVDRAPGAVRKKKTVSDSVAADQAKEESKTDLVRAAASAPSLETPKSVTEPVKEPVHKAAQPPRFEIEMARVIPVTDPKPILPKAVAPKVYFPTPLQKPLQKLPRMLKKKQEKKKPLELAHQTPPSLSPSFQSPSSQSSQGGVGSGKAPSKGEAVPITSASYSIGSLGNKPPSYPERARRNEFEGRVLLRVTVSPSGKSKTITLKTSSGFTILDEAAKAAVKAWRFVPAKRAGVAVSATIDVPIVFRLTNAQ